MKQPEHSLNLHELLGDYLRRQVATHQDGLARPAVEGDVLPYESGPAQPVEPRLAWEEAAAVFRFYPPAPAKAAKAPPEWALVVAAQDPVTALPFCAGHFPQMVRDVHALLRGDLQGPPATHQPVAAEALTAWAEETVQKDAWPQVVLALGMLRLTRQFELAAEGFHVRGGEVPAEWRAAWANEEASLAWQQGQRREAAALWQAQPESMPVLFNRGMAALFLGEPRGTRSALRQAADQLPESSAWHHLARLYLALAESRGE